MSKPQFYVIFVDNDLGSGQTIAYAFRPEAWIKYQASGGLAPGGWVIGSKGYDTHEEAWAAARAFGERKGVPIRFWPNGNEPK